MISKLIDKVNATQAKEGLVPFEIGDTVRVHTLIREGNKERIQVFPGTVIARKGSGTAETFIVRRISHGVGVEKVFPVHSPFISKIEVERSGHVRRAKLYYLRNLAGKKARLREKVRK